MKKQAYTLIAMLVLVGSMAVAAQAQTSGQMTANIPFRFNVGNKSMPAGKYTVAQISRVVLQLRGQDSNAVVLMNPITGKAEDDSMLIFHRYGNRYFFAEAWIGGESDGLQAPKVRAERA